MQLEGDYEATPTKWVRDQIEVDIQRRSMTADELTGIFGRADAPVPRPP